MGRKSFGLITVQFLYSVQLWDKKLIAEYARLERV